MKTPSLNTQILTAAVIGLAVGVLCQTIGIEKPPIQSALYMSGLIGGLFVDLLKMILVPLVFTSIAVGIANLQAHQQIQQVWITTLCFFVSSMLIAIAIGMTASHLFSPGAGLHIAMFADATQHFDAKQMSLGEFVSHFLHGLFMNPFASLAQGNVLAIVVFAIFVGIALVIGGPRYKLINEALKEFLDLTMRIVGWVMMIAPLGIAALLIKLVATQDAALFGSLAKFVAVVLGSTLLHGVVVLPLILWLFTRMKPLTFWRGAREALVTAMATSSSSATLPVTLRCAQQQLKVKEEVAGFVIPLGATLNMDGTALYEAAAALFIANLVGVELSFMQQLIVCFTSMIAAMGAPGIPSAGMVTMVLVLQSVGLPAEAIAILLPIDRLLDTFRTAVNVEGDMVGSLVVNQLVKDEKGTV